MNNFKSAKLFEESKELIPGGVNSPVRAYGAVGINPPFVKKGKGSKITDEDGNVFIDYVGSWGPMILGHGNKEVLDIIRDVLEDGTSFGAPTQKELQLARLMIEAVPSLEKIRMVSSGTEAVMSAVRLARGYTKKDKIIKFEGCYHGHSDGMLVKAGSGALSTGVPDSLGVPQDYAKNTITVSYNSFEEVEKVFSLYKDQICGVIVEPVAGNMGVVPPKKGFLEYLRDITAKNNALLIFDEVITGFRVSFGGAQGYYGIKPDISVFGKIIGGGLPVGAYGGKKEIMDMISPKGPVYQAGTLSGNPVAMSAGIKTLEILRDNPWIYKDIEDKAFILEEGIKKSAQKNGIPATINRVGSMLSVFFTKEPVDSFKSAISSNLHMFKKYFRNMLERGIYIAPSQFEAMFVSSAHTSEDMEITIKAVSETFSEL